MIATYEKYASSRRIRDALNSNFLLCHPISDLKKFLKMVLQILF